MVMVSVRWSRLRRPLLVAAGLLAMAALLAWLMGAFQHRVPPGPPVPSAQRAPPGARHPVRLVRVQQAESAVGTVRAVRETAVASRILARIKTLNVERAGQPVHKDEVLVELESADLQAALEQAGAARKAAITRRDKARIDFERTEQLARQGIASADRLDSDRTALEAAEAEVERIQQAVAAADSALGFATILAPITGIVVDKRVNQGDVVQPGQLICTLYDPTHLQLVATVREELASRLQIGQPVAVTLEALGKECQGNVAEIVPEAESRTRSFEVKVTGPCHPGVVTGMFGRLHVPVDDRMELQVPQSAVRSVGQLDFVYVVSADDALVRRYVRTGRRHGEVVEVLAGLQEGEVVLQDARGL